MKHLRKFETKLIHESKISRQLERMLPNLSDSQKSLIKEIEDNYDDLVSEITTDFGDIIIMLKGKLINVQMYNRLSNVINKYKLSFGMSYYRNDNRLMLRHFKTGPINFSHRELWGE
jgi:hypothetical protein